MSNFNLYRIIDQDVACFKLASRHRRSHAVLYDNVPYLSDILPNDPNLFPVDAYFTTHGIATSDHNNIDTHYLPTNPQKDSLRALFKALPQALQGIVGTVSFPADNGTAIIEQAKLRKKLFGASDASFKNNRASHAWIISPGSPEDINHPNMSIKGSRLVHGISHCLYSTRGELQGVTAASIIGDLLSTFHTCRIPLLLTDNNQGVPKKCQSLNQ
jgi:hypothetical protein